MYSLYEYNKAGHMRVVKEEGREEGIATGIKNTTLLMSWLFSQNRDDDVKKATQDPKYLEILFDEYNAAHKDRDIDQD